MDLTNFELITSVLMGLGLAAACGFRVFSPLFIVSAAGISGWLPLNEQFAWVGSWTALVVFGAATLFEIGAYYVPWIDNLLDTVSGPAATVAGVMMMASALGELDPAVKWTLAVIAGGGVAAGVQSATTLVRGASTAASGGLANPVVATVETVAAPVLAIASIVVPILAGMLVLLVGAAAFLLVRRVLRRRKLRERKPGLQLVTGSGDKVA